MSMSLFLEFLESLAASGNLRRLPKIDHLDKWIVSDGERMLNLSSNDYLGLAERSDWKAEFLETDEGRQSLLSSSSSRLLTGNFPEYELLEQTIARSFGREAVLLFNSGYHANTGILPALAGKRDLILADKLVHASIIDGLKLGEATFKRFRHNDYDQLERLLAVEREHYETIFVVTESLFSMDGDLADLDRLVALKRCYPNVMLYVDEAHAIGVRGERGLGLAEETGHLADIDLLVGTFGKALASMGAYLVCSEEIRSYLINKMRPLIFSTALPPFQMAWTRFVWDRLLDLGKERERLARTSTRLAEALRGHGGEISRSHIVPWSVGDSAACVLRAEEARRKGFYCLPVRPPTVPVGTSRIRFSLTANVTDEEVGDLIRFLSESLNKVSS